VLLVTIYEMALWLEREDIAGRIGDWIIIGGCAVVALIALIVLIVELSDR
jgi:hypothetical protein